MGLFWLYLTSFVWDHSIALKKVVYWILKWWWFFAQLKWIRKLMLLSWDCILIKIYVKISFVFKIVRLKLIAVYVCTVYTKVTWHESHFQWGTATSGNGSISKISLFCILYLGSPCSHPQGPQHLSILPSSTDSWCSPLAPVRCCNNKASIPFLSQSKSNCIKVQTVSAML